MARETLGQLTNRLNLTPGMTGGEAEIKPTDPVNGSPNKDNTSDSAPKFDIGGIYNYEPANDKKLFGANLDVLHTLETINFNSYSDGALRQNIAYIKFWGDSKLSADVIDPDIFGKVEVNTELRKCFDLKDSKECKYTFEENIKLPTFSLETSTQNPEEEVGKSLFDTLRSLPLDFTSELRFTDGFNENAKYEIATTSDPFKQYEGDIQKYISSLPLELQALIPPAPKPPTLVEQGENATKVIQDYSTKAREWLDLANEYTNKLPAQASDVKEAIVQTSNTISGFLGQVDKFSRILSQVFSVTGQVVESWDQIRGFFDRDLNIPAGSSLLEDLGVSTPDLEIPLDTTLTGFGLDIPLNESIFSADVSSKVEKISTYSCKEVLSKKEGVWQFLFNPSQLVYNYDSDYATADVWATPDGKPLHWKGNNNVELQFSDILLNGYMFGRKVEYLAQGLKDLMGFGGSTYIGSPPVLEFVWGSKRFGPCMMKDLTITESLWDGGELVGATCNFTLVRVPEWIVNDGYVDIFDPSRTPVFIPRVPDDLLNEDVGETTGDEVIGQANTNAGAKDDPIDINNTGQTTTASTGINQNTEICKIHNSIKQDLSIAINLYNSATKQVETIPGIQLFPGQRFKHINQGNYVNWYLAVNRLVEKFFNTTIVNANKNPVNIVDAFLNSNQKCDYRGKVRVFPGCNKYYYGFEVLEPTNKCYKSEYLKFRLRPAMECYNNLIYYAKSIYEKSCLTPQTQIKTLNVSNSVYCGRLKESERLVNVMNIEIIQRGGSNPFFPTPNLSQVRKGLFDDYKIVIDKLINNGVYNISALTQFFNTRKDLSNNVAKKWSSIVNYSVDLSVHQMGFSKGSCDSALKYVSKILSASEYDNFIKSVPSKTQKDFQKFISNVYTKCIKPINSLKSDKKNLGCR